MTSFLASIIECICSAISEGKVAVATFLAAAVNLSKETKSCIISLPSPNITKIEGVSFDSLVYFCIDCSQLDTISSKEVIFNPFNNVISSGSAGLSI